MIYQIPKQKKDRFSGLFLFPKIGKIKCCEFSNFTNRITNKSQTEMQTDYKQNERKREKEKKEAKKRIKSKRKILKEVKNIYII